MGDNSQVLSAEQYELLKQIEQAVEQRFIKLYNKQGHYSASQSISHVYGRCMAQLARVAQCVCCCQCKGCFSIKDSVDSKRFLINFTKLIAIALLFLNIAFVFFTINEHVSMNSQSGSGVLFWHNTKFTSFPKQSASE